MHFLLQLKTAVLLNLTDTFFLGFFNEKKTIETEIFYNIFFIFIHIMSYLINASFLKKSYKKTS